MTFVLIRGLLVAPGWDWSPKRPSHTWKLTTFSPTSPSREGRRARNRVINQSCLHDEASIKISIVWGSGTFIHLSRVWHFPTPWGQKLLCLGPSELHPMYLFT